MTATKKKLKKYNILNVEEDKLIGEKLTKKATIEWLQKEISKLNESQSLLFAAEVYGEKLPTLNLHPVVIKHINNIAGEERLLKLINKSLTLSDVKYKITLWEETE